MSGEPLPWVMKSGVPLTFSGWNPNLARTRSLQVGRRFRHRSLDPQLFHDA
jgi:hypothetical protein